ncbi:NUDIX domain-containing protein [Rhodospirillales bacterium]|nr:NUDIX domain-containing protein [Rhodospirillales bacterium]
MSIEPQVERVFPFTGQIDPADASAVILTDDTGRYVVQRRDIKPGIFYPGHLGLFGGACNKGESFENAAVRELNEEISLNLEGRLTFFTRMTLGFEPFGKASVEREFFHAALSRDEVEKIIVREGVGFEAIKAETLLTVERMVPYDAFAVWLHCNT